MNSKFERAEQGFSLLELLLGVVMMAMVIVGVAALVNRQGDEAKANVVALQLKTIGDAAGEYIKDAQSVLLQNTQTNNSKVIITLPMLQAAGYLNTGFNVTNAFQQNTCVVVRRTPNPTNNPQLGNDLLGLVITQGGNAIDDLTLGQISATIGGGGGAIYAQNSTQVTGALGGWNFNKTIFEGATVAGLNTLPGGAQALPAGQNCSGAGNIALAAGHPTVSLWFSNGASRSASGTLYRNAVAGQPELNTMNTALLTGTAAIIPDTQIGQPCNVDPATNANVPPTTRGAIGTGQDGSVVSCVNNVWTKVENKFWGAPADTIASLGICDASKAGATRMVKSTAGGVAFSIHPYVPYTCNGMGAWKPIAIDQSGNLQIAGNTQINGSANVNGSLNVDALATVGNLNVKRTSNLGGDVTVDGNVYASWIIGKKFEASDSMQVGSGGIYSVGQIISQNDITSQRSLKGKQLGLEPMMRFVGQSCPASDHGALSMSLKGDLLICIWKSGNAYGYWRKSGGGFSGSFCTNNAGSQCTVGNPFTNGSVCSCPAGSSQHPMGQSCYICY